MVKKAQRVKLGKTGLEVSRLCVGTDYRDVYGDAKQGGALLRRALELGLNFWDTADDYGAYPGIREALKSLDRSEVVIATKTYGSTGRDVEGSLERSMMEMETDYIDIFMLHAVDSVQELEKRSGALKAILNAKDRGLVRAVGLSTHTVSMTHAVVKIPEIEVVLTVLNRIGTRIQNGSLIEMEKATEKLYDTGKGVYLMKVLGRGQLVQSVESALRYALELPYVHSVCVGIRNIEELGINVEIANKLLEA